MIKRARWLHTISAGAAAMLLAACSDSATLPELHPAYHLADAPASGLPASETSNLDPDPNIGCVLNGTTCVLGPLGGPVSSPTDIDVIDPCDYDPYACNPSSGGGGGASGGGGGGSGLPGDADSDGDTLDDGPIAFAGCVLGNLGLSGWGALGGSALSVYQLWEARNNTREAEARYVQFISTHHDSEDHDVMILYARMWDDAKEAESFVYKQLAVTSGIALGEIAKAAIKCSMTAVAPSI